MLIRNLIIIHDKNSGCVIRCKKWIRRIPPPFSVYNMICTESKLNELDCETKKEEFVNSSGYPLAKEIKKIGLHPCKIINKFRNVA